MCLEGSIRMLKMSPCLKPQWKVTAIFTMHSMAYHYNTGRKEKHSHL